MVAPKLLESMRAHRAHLPPFQNLYPYAMGRIEGALKDATRTPKQRIASALETIEALDIVNEEPEELTNDRTR